MSDTELAAGTIAGTIGADLAKSVVGAAGQFAFGEILNMAGVSEQAELGAKLDQILAAISQLQSTVDELANELRARLSQLAYDVAIKPVQTLIDRNTALGGMFKALLVAAPAEVAAKKQDIAALMDGDFLQGLATWNSALCGSSGQTGLLRAWNAAVGYRDLPSAGQALLFGADASKAVQDQWDYLDAQQAMTVNFLVEHFNATGQPLQARQTVTDWSRNRQAQLGLLRGAVRPTDTFATIDENGQPVTVETPVKVLPPFTIVSLKSAMMWYLKIGAAVPQLQTNGLLAKEVAPMLAEAVHTTGKSGWSILDPDTIGPILYDCGGRNYQVKDAMIARGFIVPAGPSGYAIWTSRSMGWPPNRGIWWQWSDYPSDIPGPNARERRLVAYADGSGWLYPAYLPTDRANVLFGRRLESNEAADYWYDATGQV
jgi:hypothetical protein